MHEGCGQEDNITATHAEIAKICAIRDSRVAETRRLAPSWARIAFLQIVEMSDLQLAEDSLISQT